MMLTNEGLMQVPGVRSGWAQLHSCTAARGPTTLQPAIPGPR